MSFLLDEAINEYGQACVDAGLPLPKKRRRRKAIRRDIGALKRQIAPLLLPEDLVIFWEDWELESFNHPSAGNEFLTPDDVAAIRRANNYDLLPKALLEIYAEDKYIWGIELASLDHPGSRIFDLDFEEQRAVAIGIAGFIELMTASIRASLNEGLRPDEFEFRWMPDHHERQRLASQLTQAGADFYQKLDWPQFWLDAENVSDEDLALKGATHTVSEFDRAREQAEVTNGVLQGEFRVAMSDRNGTVGKLTDASGSIQVFIPQATINYGPPNGLMEMSVFAVPQNGQTTASLRGLAMRQAHVFPSDHDARMFWHNALNDAIARLDVTVVATSIRQIR